MKKSPLTHRGDDYLLVCKNIADFFHYEPSELFPIEIYSMVQPIISFEIGFSQLPHHEQAV
ncbi:MAG: hypothetical protein AAB870_02105, partial [Patescibacteria group bacterium]